MAEFVGLDLAWKVGFVRARKAEKKLAKNGRCVGAMLGVEATAEGCLGTHENVETVFVLVCWIV